jgi:hypothetical protein
VKDELVTTQPSSHELALIVDESEAGLNPLEAPKYDLEDIERLVHSAAKSYADDCNHNNNLAPNLIEELRREGADEFLSATNFAIEFLTAIANKYKIAA